MRLAARHRVPVALLVWTFDEATARLARGPHTLGPGFAFEPIVIGPRDLPVVGSADDAAKHLDLAVLVALTRLGELRSRRRYPGRDEAEVLRVAEAAASVADEATRRAMTSLLHGTAIGPFRAILKQFLEAHIVGALDLIREEGKAEGLAEGRAQVAATLLRLLRQRGFEVDEHTSARVRATSDDALLHRWLDRVIAAESIEDVFAD